MTSLEKRPVRCFCIKIAVALCSCLVVPLVSYVGDAGHVFHSQEYVAQVADYLHAGYNVAGVANLDERMLNARLIHDRKTAPQLVILGSSRAMVLSSSLLKRPLVNHGMSGASLEDLFAIYQLYRERRLRPDTILLCIDPWMLNENYDDVRWKTLEREAEALELTIGIGRMADSNRVTRLRSRLRVMRARLQNQLFSPDYFRNSAQLLLLHWQGAGVMVPTHEVYNTEATRLTDGSITYGTAYRDRSDAWVTDDARRYSGMKPVYGFSGFTSVTTRQRNAIVKFLKLLQADGVNTRLAMMPYHPIVYDALVSSGKNVGLATVEREVMSIAAELGIRVAGSYSPTRAGLRSSDFFDAMHPKSDPSASIARSALLP